MLARVSGAQTMLNGARHKSDAEYHRDTHNTARFFTEHRQVALILLLATFVWGWYGYQNMPKRKDPNIPGAGGGGAMPMAGRYRGTSGRTGQPADRADRRAKHHHQAAQPLRFRHSLHQFSRPGDRLHPARRQRNDKTGILRHQPEDQSAERKLPRGAGPIQFNSDFGDTAALMLTVASPMASPTEISLRARAIREA